MNPVPLPPALPVCPNCGLVIEGQPKFCPRCGAALPWATAAPKSWVTTGAQIFLGIAAAFLAFVAVCLGMFGACFVVMEGGSARSDSKFFFGFGVAALVLAGICIWGIFYFGRRKRS